MSDGNHPPRITVVGDLILDRYLIGDATKLNPEMPGVVIRVDREDDRLGGAAAVAMIAAGFGAKVTLAGVVGRDEPGARLRQLLDTQGIESHLWTDERPTTWKQRIVARGQLRPDRCDREVTTPIGTKAERFLATLPIGDVLLISDYGKGVCTRRLLQRLGNLARLANVPILVDPARLRNWSDYGAVSLIKANWVEANEAAGTPAPGPLALVRSLSDRHECDVVATLGRHGLVCAQRGEPVWYLPASATDLRDVCGAGDTVLAALGLAMVQGDALRTACRFAIAAAGQQVGNLGVATVRVDWGSTSETNPRAEFQYSQGQPGDSRNVRFSATAVQP